MKIIAYAFEAALHCPDCTRDAAKRMERSGDPDAKQDEHGLYDDLVDREGNDIHPVFSTDEMEEGECCDDCREEL